MPPNQPPLNFPPPPKRVDFLGPLLQAAQLKFKTRSLDIQEQQFKATQDARVQQQSNFETNLLLKNKQFQAQQDQFAATRRFQERKLANVIEQQEETRPTGEEEELKLEKLRQDVKTGQIPTVGQTQGNVLAAFARGDKLSPQRAQILKKLLSAQGIRIEVSPDGTVTVIQGDISQATTASQTLNQGKLDAIASTAGTLTEFKSLLSPENVGAVGSFRRFSLGVSQQVQAFGLALRKDVQSSIKRFGFKGDSSVFFATPSTDAEKLQAIGTDLAYKLSEAAEGPGRKTTEDIKIQKERLGVGKWLSNVAAITARVETIENSLARGKVIAEKRLGIDSSQTQGQPIPVGKTKAGKTVFRMPNGELQVER